MRELLRQCAKLARKALREGKEITLFEYIIAYFQEEQQRQIWAFNPNDGLDMQALVKEATESYMGGAR